MQIPTVGRFGANSPCRILWVALLLLIGAVASSCAKGTNRLPDVSWEGDHIRFSTSVDHLPCGDSLTEMDRHVGELAAALDEKAPPDEKIDYYWLPDRMDLTPCPPSTDCAEGTNVYSRTMFHYHEIVHVLLRKLGRSQTFLFEGMAEAFGRSGGRLTVPREQARSEILKSLSARVDPATISYPLAGLFVRFLIDTYGFASIKQVYIRAREDTDIDDFRRIFKEECGVELNEAMDRFIEEAKTCYPRINLCVSPSVPWDGSVWKYDFGMGCSDSGVLEIAPGALRNEALIEISQAGAYAVSVSSEQPPAKPVVILKYSCEAKPYFIEVGSEQTLTLEPGKYRVLAGRMASDLTQDLFHVQVRILAPTP